jgi:hypothetical protein
MARTRRPDVSLFLRYIWADAGTWMVSLGPDAGVDSVEVPGAGAETGDTPLLLRISCCLRKSLLLFCRPLVRPGGTLSTENFRPFRVAGGDIYGHRNSSFGGKDGQQYDSHPRS